MLSDEILQPEERAKVAATYPTYAHFFLDTRGAAYAKGCGAEADKVHRLGLDYPHLLMSHEDYFAYFSQACPEEVLHDCWPEYAKLSNLVWWSGNDRNYRMKGLSPYLASFFAECDSIYVPKWAQYEHERWARGTYRGDAMLDNLMLVSQKQGEDLRARGIYNAEQVFPVLGSPYRRHGCASLGPMGLCLGTYKEQGGTDETLWTWPLFIKIPMLAWILSRPEKELRIVYNLRPPAGYEPKSLPKELANYVPPTVSPYAGKEV